VNVKLRFLLATRNEGKRAELDAVLNDLDVSLLTLDEFDEMPDAVEDGPTFAENARRKALHYFRLTNCPTIADDSGLSVDALDGQPGIYSARFAPTDPERIQKLLAMLREVRHHNRTVSRSAHFTCAICLVVREGLLVQVEGRVDGEISDCPRGESGFGYDPVFFYPPLGKTFGELKPEEKNRISHRAVALRMLKQRIRAGILPENSHGPENC
jgi:XTP/dITP diphosphohydrolase